MIRSSLLLAFPLLLSSLSLACGGKVVVDAPPGGSGGAGGGNVTTTSTVSPDTSTFVASSSFVAATATTGLDVGSTSTGIMVGCDGTGICQDDGGGDSCVVCAVQGPCINEMDACQSSMECVGYQDCTSNCGNNPNCQQNCSQKFPEGQKLFFTFVQCVVCLACPMDCAQFANGFCP